MVYNYNGVKVFYEMTGGGEARPIILLHGWARSSEDFKKLVDAFPQRRFLLVDFPPFGNSQQDIKGWTIYSYAGMLMSLCEHLNITSADFVGHSFGGRLVIILAAVKRSLVHSCILVDSAGMKPKRSFKYRFQLIEYKLKRRLGMNVEGGSSDYKALSPEMKETFKSIVNTFLEPYAKKMTVKTLIVWGNEDKETPLYMAKRLNRLIKNSRLLLLDGGHFSFLDSPFVFYSEVNKFWEEVK